MARGLAHAGGAASRGGPQAQQAAARFLQDGRRSATAPRSEICAPARRRPPPRAARARLSADRPVDTRPSASMRRISPVPRSAVAIASLAGRKWRHRHKQRVDLGQKPVAPAIERRGVERRIGVDALEAVLRQNLTVRRRDRNAALGVEAVREMGEESVHFAPRPAQSRGPDERPRGVPMHDLLTGCRGIAWDPMGVNEATAIPAPGTSP